MRTKILLVVLCVGLLPQALWSQVVILSRGTVKVGCGSFEKSTPVTVTKAAPGEVKAEIERLTLALKAMGATFPRIDVVKPGSAYAIGVVQKKAGNCEWEIQLWRISDKGAEAAKEALTKVMKAEPNQVGYSVQEAVALD